MICGHPLTSIILTGYVDGISVCLESITLLQPPHFCSVSWNRVGKWVFTSLEERDCEDTVMWMYVVGWYVIMNIPILSINIHLHSICMDEKQNYSCKKSNDFFSQIFFHFIDFYMQSWYFLRRKNNNHVMQSILSFVIKSFWHLKFKQGNYPCGFK